MSLQLSSEVSRQSLAVIHFGDVVRTTLGTRTGPEMRFRLTDPRASNSRHAVTLRDRLCLTPWSQDKRAAQKYAVTFEIETYQPPALFDPTQRCGLQAPSGRSLAATVAVELAQEFGQPECIFLFEPHPNRTSAQLHYGEEACLRVGNHGFLATGPRGEVFVDREAIAPRRWQVLDPECPSSRALVGHNGNVALLSPSGAFLSLPRNSEICAIRQAIGPHEVLKISSPTPRESRTRVH
ncbi:MAG: hypothetical protein ACPG4T_07375 [Nannocystaceae bacterium]